MGKKRGKTERKTNRNCVRTGLLGVFFVLCLLVCYILLVGIDLSVVVNELS